jgi:hypothetical protein
MLGVAPLLVSLDRHRFVEGSQKRHRASRIRPVPIYSRKTMELAFEDAEKRRASKTA